MTSKNGSWQDALKVFLDIIHEPLKKKNYKWAIMGSVASILQGCDLHPSDIDILVKDPKIVHYISSFFTDYYKESKSASPFGENGLWLATKEQPVFEGLGPFKFKWTYSKFKINGFSIEITHKLPWDDHPETTTNLWESGQNVWSHIGEVSFDTYRVPVLPLEIQISTNLERGFEDRVKQIIGVLNRRGYDKELLDRTLNKQQRKKINELFLKSTI